MVGGQHELFDHFMCIVMFSLGNSFHLPFGVHVNFRFGYLEIDASRLKPALSQNPAELVHLFQNTHGLPIMVFSVSFFEEVSHLGIGESGTAFDDRVEEL